MSITVGIPTVLEFDHVLRAISDWQYDGGPLQLHPGDLGWYSTRGIAATAAAVRTWSRDGAVLALALAESDEILRMALDPALRDDEELVRHIADDVDDPQAGFLGSDGSVIEARGADCLVEELLKRGWQRDELWSPFSRSLVDPVEELDVRVELVGPDRADDWTAVHWSAFRGTPLSAEDHRRLSERWCTMAQGAAYANARSLIAYDADGVAVAVAAVWSAGRGRPGLIEPMGVHQDHRGHGYGRAITIAAAAALRQLGASGATVCAESSNVGAVATYAAAGFTPHEPVPDLRRKA